MLPASCSFTAFLITTQLWNKFQISEPTGDTALSNHHTRGTTNSLLPSEKMALRKWDLNENFKTSQPCWGRNHSSRGANACIWSGMSFSIYEWWPFGSCFFKQIPTVLLSHLFLSLTPLVVLHTRFPRTSPVLILAPYNSSSKHLHHHHWLFLLELLKRKYFLLSWD